MNKIAGPKPNLKQTLEIIERELKNGNLKRAENIAGHLRASYPRRPEVNDILGTVVARQGDFSTAYHFHKLAADSDKFNVNYLANIATDLVKMGRAVEAEAAYRRILEIDPNAHTASLALGRFYQDIGLGERALEHFETALRQADATDRPRINYERMSCLAELGRTAEIQKLYEEGFEAGTSYTRFISLYATIDKWKVDSEAYALVMKELQDRDLARDMRGALLTNKARMEENSGLYEQSYETLLMAKRQESAAFDLQRFIQRSDKRIANLNRAFLKECAGKFGHPSSGHVFVVGMPRSGTTLTEQIIASHSMAGGVGELETMAYLTAKLMGNADGQDIEKAVADLGKDGIFRLGEEYKKVTRFLAPGKQVVVDKMPHNFTRIGEISLLFPHAKFVHCTRNVADTFISAFQNDMNAAHSYSYDRDSYADYYDEYLRLMRHWYDAVPGRIFTLEYEKLVTSPEPVIRSLLDFLELPFEEACLNPQDRGGLVKTFSRLQVRSAINAKSVGRWQNYERQLAPLAKRFENIEPFPPIS